MRRNCTLISKKKWLTMLLLWLSGVSLQAYSQVVYPYFPEANVKESLSGVATSVTTPSTFVVDQTGDFTLEVQGTVGVPIKISNGVTGYEYTPGQTSTVRFVKASGLVYVYENAVYKTIIGTSVFQSFPAIRSDADNETSQTGIYNPLNMIDNPGFETRVSQGSTTHFKDGVYWDAFNEAKALDWSTGTTAAIRNVSTVRSEGSYSIVMHGTTRYLTQNLGKLKANTYYQLSYDYWTSSPASNGGATYNIMLGTAKFLSDVTSLTGHTTSATEVTQKNFSGIFKTPATVPDADIWLTLYRSISKVDWIDRVTLLESSSSSAAAGIHGVTSTALYVSGVAYAPKVTLNLTAGDYFEMTPLVVNPSFENSFNGWTNDGLVTQTNTSFTTFKDGATYIEKWVSAAPVPNVSVRQTISSLPNGSYTLLAAGHHILQTPLSGKKGAVIFGNQSQTEVKDRAEYTVNFLVVDGKATIGAEVKNSEGNWAAFDNFRLRYKGFVESDIKAYLQQLKDSATVLYTSKMNAAVKTELGDAMDAAQAALDATGPVTNLADIVNRLQNAIASANISIGGFAQLQQVIDSANTLYATGTGNDAATFYAEIVASETLVDNLNASLTDLTNGVTELRNAMFVYQIKNPSGVAPTVVTNPDFARGATMAFGRSTITGIAINDLLEHGYCWSTSPEPTVLDNRTTKYFSNNGFIYRLENLQPATVYYMRAYAISKTYAVGYGNVVKVITIPKGTVTYTFASSVNNASDPNITSRIKSAIESAVDVYFNNLTSIQGHRLDVRYNAGTPTAEASYGGYLQFGPTASYQRTGTALHEMGHTIGVGQHTMWYGPNSPLRATGSSGAWLGERANKLVQFIDNDPAGYMRGDAVHMWPYGINGAQEDNGTELLYTANALIHQALGEDGLPPTGGFATPAYTFLQTDTTKYYIKIEDKDLGRDVAFLAEDNTGKLFNKVIKADDVLSYDSAAWYLTFNPATAYYQIKNVATGKYFTYQASGENGVGLTAVATPGVSQSFQLMGARYTSRIGKDGDSISAKAYWIIRPQSTLTPPTLAGTLTGATSVVSFYNNNSAISQRWFIFSKAEVDSFKRVETIVQPIVASPRAASGDNEAILTWDKVFGLDYYILRATTATGTYDTIAAALQTERYEDKSRTNGNTYYYKIVAFNGDNFGPESAVLSATPEAGQHVYISFNETAGTVGEDVWGGYHADLQNAAAFVAGKAGNGLQLNGSTNAYATLRSGAISELNNFTLSAWVKMESLSNWMRIFDFGRGTNNYMFLTAQASTNASESVLRYVIKNGGAEQILNYNYIWPVGSWVHIALTQSDTETKMYINGLVVATTTTINIKPADLGITTLNYIGKSQFSADPMLRATVDEFKIFNTVLSGTEVMFLNNVTLLPVKLISFDGHSTPAGNLLQWSTSQEINSDYFELERSVANASSFTAINKIASRGGESTTSYEYTDATATEGINYYRLKQVDKDGKTTYSRIVAIDNKLKARIKAYPNPFSNTLNIELPSDSKTALVKIVSSDGRTVFEQKLAVANKLLQVKSLKLAAGIYQVNIQTSKDNYQLSVIRE